jgi:carboxyl-terminal processing protease
MNYIDANRAELSSRYKKFDTYARDFQIDEKCLQELLTMAEEEKIPFEEEQYNRSKALIALQLKALIARDLFDMAEYFHIINADNPSYQKALEIINDKTTYNRLLGK